MCGTAAEVSAVNSVDDREIPCPGPMTAADRRGVPQGRARPDRPLQGLGRTCPRLTERTRPDRTVIRDPGLPESVEIYDTTLRDGSQLEGISLTVDDKLRIAEQLDYLGVHVHRGRLAGRQPEGRRVLRAGRTGAAAAPVDAGRLRVDPPGQGQGRRRRDAAQPGRRRHVRGVHRRQVLGLPRHRGAADHARRGRGHGGRLGRASSPARACGCCSTPSTSSTAGRRTPSSACGCSRRRPSTAPRRSCSATPTAARCPTRSRRSCGRSPATSATTSRSASTCTTTPAAAWPTRWPGCGRARCRCRARSTATASAPATATSPRSSRPSR